MEAFRNRDIERLSKLRDTETEMEALERRLQWQRDRLRQVTRYIASGPQGGGKCGMDDAMATLEELEREYQTKVKSYRRELRRGEQILNSIESQQMRTFVRLVYVEKRSAAEVRKEMGLSRWSFAAARDAAENAECASAIRWREKWHDRKNAEE